MPSSAPEPIPTSESLGILSRAKDAIFLPKEMTAFEGSYLKKMNRIALWFFCAHLPVFMAIAALNGTGVLPVALLTIAVLAVPLLGLGALTNERHKSYVLAFTSMCMGGVLVHAGQGPVQIEMHFYFFSILAMLALFANPMTVIVGAATVAVHHLALWYFAPASIFNYDAPLWVVLVHASFVVLETFAACFIARNFFDNVIGLEKKVEERTAQLEKRNREMSVVLDSIQQGIVKVNGAGELLPEHSPAILTFFGEFREGETFADYLSRSCVTTAEWFSMNWEALTEGFLPLELAIDQLPKAARIEGRSYLFEYRAEISKSDELDSLLVVVSDRTSEVDREAAESLQRELLIMLERALRDPRGFSSFHSEATSLLAEISKPIGSDASPEEKRALHTMKGNAAAFGLTSVAEACHDLESAWQESSKTVAQVRFAELSERWDELSITARKLLGTQDEDQISVRTSDLQTAFEAACEAGSMEVAGSLANLLLEPTSPILEQLEAQALHVAERLEKCQVQTSIDSHGVRIKRAGFDDLFASMTHVVRNAIDHGLELPEEREACQKNQSGTVSLETEIENNCLVLTVEDDGRGICWDVVREKALEKNLPHESEGDLIDALFSDEFSTSDRVTEFSGRGVGLAAVNAAVKALNGTIQVTSTHGEGTRMQFIVPLDVVSGHIAATQAAAQTSPS